MHISTELGVDADVSGDGNTEFVGTCMELMYKAKSQNDDRPVRLS